MIRCVQALKAVHNVRSAMPPVMHVSAIDGCEAQCEAIEDGSVAEIPDSMNTQLDEAWYAVHKALKELRATVNILCFLLLLVDHNDILCLYCCVPIAL